MLSLSFVNRCSPFYFLFRYQKFKLMSTQFYASWVNVGFPLVFLIFYATELEEDGPKKSSRFKSFRRIMHFSLFTLSILSVLGAFCSDNSNFIVFTWPFFLLSYFRVSLVSSVVISRSIMLFTFDHSAVVNCGGKLWKKKPLENWIFWILVQIQAFLSFVKLEYTYSDTITPINISELFQIAALSILSMAYVFHRATCGFKPITFLKHSDFINGLVHLLFLISIHRVTSDDNQLLISDLYYLPFPWILSVIISQFDVLKRLFRVTDNRQNVEAPVEFSQY